MIGKSEKDVQHRSDTFESRRSAFRGIKRLLDIPVVTHPTESIRNKGSEAWKREGLRREQNKGLYIFKWLGSLFSIREDDGSFYIDQGSHFNYGKHGKKLKGHGFFPKKKKK